MSERENKTSGGLTYADLRKDADGFYITNDRLNKKWSIFQKIPYGKVSTPEAEKVWHEFRKFMLHLTSAAEVSNWLDCLEPFRIEGSKLIVYSPSSFISETVKSNYHSVITKFINSQNAIKMIDFKIYYPSYIKY